MSEGFLITFNKWIWLVNLQRRIGLHHFPSKIDGTNPLLSLHTPLDCILLLLFVPWEKHCSCPWVPQNLLVLTSIQDLPKNNLIFHVHWSWRGLGITVKLWLPVIALQGIFTHSGRCVGHLLGPSSVSSVQPLSSLHWAAWERLVEVLISQRESVLTLSVSPNLISKVEIESETLKSVPFLVILTQ